MALTVTLVAGVFKESKTALGVEGVEITRSLSVCVLSPDRSRHCTASTRRW